jgi:membrane-bound serine protease (ClpP class)
MTLLITLILTGLLLIGAEVFVPGGILGAIGLMALVAAVIMGFMTQGPIVGGYLAAAVVLLAGLSIFLWAKYFPKTRFGRGMTLSEDGKAFKSARADLANLVGQEGTAQSDLRPGGIARIGSKRVDVVAEGTLVPAGTALTVIKVVGNRVIVRPQSTGPGP